MNLQTTKPVARWHAARSCWLITHPLSELGIATRHPHDGAVMLLREHVLPQQIRPVREVVR